MNYHPTIIISYGKRFLHLGQRERTGTVVLTELDGGGTFFEDVEEPDAVGTVAAAVGTVGNGAEFLADEVFFGILFLLLEVEDATVFGGCCFWFFISHLSKRWI